VLHRIQQFLRRESGQDLAEYCLLTALLALIALGIILHVSGGLQGIWGTANSTLATSGGSGSTITGAAASAPTR
jgi:Flp pilus assembly pilin Flp